MKAVFPFFPISIFLVLIIAGCDHDIERSGVVVDSQTQEPIPGVSVDIYLKDQSGDSLMTKVYTDANGYFHVGEKHSEGKFFLLYKEGYIGFVSKLSVANDTISLEKSGG
ncbi:MAG: hypothetical protein R2788_11955 [Saprospiraceae bacterium]